MGCDCGIRAETEAEKKECQKSVELEASDQVSMFEQFDATNTKKSWQRDKGGAGGCPAGHVPWFVYLAISGWCSNSNLDS